MTELSTYNLADIWEAVSERVSDRTALICGRQHRTYAELEDRANRVAHALASRGVGKDQHVAVYLQNCAEFLETMLGCFKIRAVPINVNYRYVEKELAYLLDDCDAVAVVYGAEFEDKLAAVLPELPSADDIAALLRVGEADAEQVPGAVGYDQALAAESGERDFGLRSNDDHYVMYTGGTTGMPKGVVWRHEDAYFSCLLGGNATRMFDGPVKSPAEILERITDQPAVFLSSAPLMHAAGQWPAFMYWYGGGTYILTSGSFDPLAIWKAVEEHGVNMLTVVGDAMARPLMDAWDEHGPFDVSTLFALSNGGAVLSPAMKDRMAETFPNVFIRDGYGSSETGAQAGIDRQPGQKSAGLGSFDSFDEETRVIADDHSFVEPGSGVVGHVGRCGHIPLGYYNDPEKTARTFVEIDGTRWVLPGDMATVAEDGSIQLLGRGSVCINTGGEKVYPEEVESALKSHPSVYDALVVGVPDERWGSRVTAVVQLTKGHDLDPKVLAGHAREQVAGYKVPKEFLPVDEVVRSPSGKPDYRWAQEEAAARTGL